MVSDIVIVAVITGLFSVVGQWLISREREIRLDERLKSVEKKLDEHNGYAARFSEIGTDIAVIKNELKNLKEAN